MPAGEGGTKVSTQCDKCLTNLPWKIDTRMQYLLTQWSTRAFSLTAIAAAFQTAVRDLGVTTAGAESVPLFNLCEKCWAKAADVWIPGQGASVYATIPAKTADTGVYFNNERVDYQDSGKPDIEKIISTCVHEMMHYWSHNHAGLQTFETGKKVHWDECVTDFLARKVYFSVAKGTYKTSYGTMSEFIKKQVAAVFQNRVPPFKLRPVTEELGRSPLAPFNEAFNSLQPDGKLKPSYSARFNEAFAKLFVTWYLKGAETPVEGRTITVFLGSSLGKMFFDTLSDSAVGYGQPTSLYSA